MLAAIISLITLLKVECKNIESVLYRYSLKTKTRLKCIMKHKINKSSHTYQFITFRIHQK